MNGAAQERDIRRSPKRVCGFPGHLRVRNASAEEMRGFARLFADPDRSGWVTETIATGRARALVVERFTERIWVPLAWTVTAADGETALALRSEEYGKGLAHEALRAAIRVLRDEPFAALTACVVQGDVKVAKAFERAGFSPEGTCRFRGRLTVKYVRNLRGDCTPYNVWI